MRLLQVIPSLAVRTGGPAVSVMAASEALQGLGHVVTVMTTDLDRPARVDFRARAREPDISDGAAQLDIRAFRSRPPRRLAASPGLGRALRGIVSDYDIVHIHSLFLYPQYAAYRAAFKSSVPYVVSPRGALDPWLRGRGRGRKGLLNVAWQKRMFGRAAAIHVTSEQEAEAVADLPHSVRRFVIPNGLRWREFAEPACPTSFRESHLAGFRGPLVLSHGRITRKKGLDVLVRAFALVAREVPDCRLALVGPDDEQLSTELMDIARNHGIAGRLTFCGMLTGSDLRSALAACDVWVLPSHTENFANAAVEALAAGCAVVLSPEVGIAADAHRSEAAIVSRRKPAALADRLTYLLRNSTARSKLGGRARDFAKRYDWVSIAPRLEQMYRKVAT